MFPQLQQVLEANRERRVVVVGTTCTGKSTLVRSIPSAYDMDELVFPLLTKEENEYVCQHPWTPEIGQTMMRLVREKVRVEPGKPVFGTVVLDSDLVVYLRISDELLRNRTQARGADFRDAKRMQEQIEEEIAQSKIPSIVLDVE
ncbi:MAG: hypothetical protein Q7S02_00720 [bacterium]|nr:hypothetical protein [bacterium]